MGVGAGLYMCDVVVKSLRSLSHLLMSSCISTLNHGLKSATGRSVVFSDVISDTYDVNTSVTKQSI